MSTWWYTVRCCSLSRPGGARLAPGGASGGNSAVAKVGATRCSLLRFGLGALVVATVAAAATACATAAPPAGPPPDAGELPAAAPSAARLSAPDIYARLAPSIAYIETALGSGTGVLVAPDRLVTNAHVPWPYTEVRVVFPDGTEIDPAPVLVWDLMADLALIDLAAGGGAPEGVPPVTIGDGADRPVGDDAFLVGYPSEVELYPQPAITRGVLSRRRTWQAIDMPFLQTDAPIAGGQSGGALVASDGSVIGISTMIFGEGDFGLSLSAPDSVARLVRLLAGETEGEPAFRPLPSSGGRRTQNATLPDPWSEAVFVLDVPYGTEVALAIDGEGDTSIVALSPFGDLDLEVDETESGREDGVVRVQEYGPYFVVADTEPLGSVTIEADAPLMPLVDPDDGTTLVVGRRATALMDFPGDFDHFFVHLARGDRVDVMVDTMSFTPDLTVYRADAHHDEPPLAEGLIGGSLAMFASAEVVADTAGKYVVVVGDADGVGTGGYYVTVER